MFIHTGGLVPECEPRDVKDEYTERLIRVCTQRRVPTKYVESSTDSVLNNLGTACYMQLYDKQRLIQLEPFSRVPNAP